MPKPANPVPLTGAEKRLLRKIEALTQKLRRCPTHAELSSALNVQAFGIPYQVQSLIAKGTVSHDAGFARHWPERWGTFRTRLLELVTAYVIKTRFPANIEIIAGAFLRRRRRRSSLTPSINRALRRLVADGALSAIYSEEGSIIGVYPPHLRTTALAPAHDFSMIMDPDARRVLNQIRDCLRGRVPTQRELAATLGTTHKVVMIAEKDLIEGGYLSRDPHVARHYGRSLRICKPLLSQPLLPPAATKADHLIYAIMLASPDGTRFTVEQLHLSGLHASTLYTALRRLAALGYLRRNGPARRRRYRSVAKKNATTWTLTKRVSPQRVTVVMQRTYNEILRHKRGFSPTLAELTRFLGFSRADILKHVRSLQGKRYIKAGPISSARLRLRGLQVAEISARDQRIVNVIADLHQESGLPPRLSDVTRRPGFATLKAQKLANLVELGFAQRHHGRIRLTPKPS